MKEPRGIIRTPVAESAEIEAFDPQLAPPGRYPTYRETAQEGFQLLDYWRAIRKRLWLVIGIVVLMTTLTAIYMARKPSIFRANAVVQVDLEQNNPDLVTADRQRPISNPDPSYFNTQLQLLLSDSLLRRAIKEHNLDTHKDLQQAKNDSGSSTFRSILRSIGLASGERTQRPAPDQNPESGLASAEEIAEAVRLN